MATAEPTLIAPVPDRGPSRQRKLRIGFLILLVIVGVVLGANLLMGAVHESFGFTGATVNEGPAPALTLRDSSGHVYTPDANGEFHVPTGQYTVLHCGQPGNVVPDAPITVTVIPFLHRNLTPGEDDLFLCGGQGLN